MASSSISNKSSCAICNKAAGIFTCRGCRKDFCVQHVAEHRQILHKRIDEVISSRNQLHQSLKEKTTENARQFCMEQIKQWEQQSIDKIHQIANEARKQVIGRHVAELTHITEELNQARSEDNFDETDLNGWIQRLNELKNDSAIPRIIKIRQDRQAIQSIKSILVHEVPLDLFEELTGNVRIEDEKQVIAHGIMPNVGSVRGKNEYSSGSHQIRFKIESIDQSQWIFFGIISQDAPMTPKSYQTPTAYGWAGNNIVFLNGVEWCGFNDYQTDMQKDDILELFIACDRQMLCLTNERTQIAHEINVDLNKCPFPWQLNLCLSYWYDRVRILMPEGP